MTKVSKSLRLYFLYLWLIMLSCSHACVNRGRRLVDKSVDKSTPVVSVSVARFLLLASRISYIASRFLLLRARIWYLSFCIPHLVSCLCISHRASRTSHLLLGLVMVSCSQLGAVDGRAAAVEAPGLLRGARLGAHDVLRQLLEARVLQPHGGGWPCY